MDYFKNTLFSLKKKKVNFKIHVDPYVVHSPGLEK